VNLKKRTASGEPVQAVPEGHGGDRIHGLHRLSCHPLPVVDGKTVGLGSPTGSAASAKFMRGVVAEANKELGAA
jgi:hypothetical protein